MGMDAELTLKDTFQVHDRMGDSGQKTDSDEDRIDSDGNDDEEDIARRAKLRERAAAMQAMAESQPAQASVAAATEAKRRTSLEDEEAV
jgi:hypothetical protein